MNKKIYSFSTRIAALLLAAAVSVGCNVDDTYDLTGISQDGIGLGTDETSFDLPLVKITVSASEMLNSTSYATRSEDEVDEVEASSGDLFEALKDLNAILPSEDVDFEQLMVSDDYANSFANNLLDEIKSDADKAEAFFEEIKEGDEYADLRAALEDDGVTVSGDATDFYTAIQQKDTFTGTIAAVISTVQEQVTANTTEVIEVGSIELGDDIISLLNENMDGDNNTLRIMAIYEQDIIYTDGTAVEAAFDTTLTAADGAEIELMDYVEPDVEISSNDGLLATADELDHVLENLTVSLNYKLKNYNAGKTFDTTDKSIKITLVARKTGSLKL